MRTTIKKLYATIEDKLNVRRKRRVSRQLERAIEQINRTSFKV